MLEWMTLAATTLVVLWLINRWMRRDEGRDLDARDESMPGPAPVSAGPVLMAPPERDRGVAA